MRFCSPGQGKRFEEEDNNKQLGQENIQEQNWRKIIKLKREWERFCHSVLDYVEEAELNFIEKSILIWHSARYLAEDAGNSLHWNLPANLLLLTLH